MLNLKRGKISQATEQVYLDQMKRVVVLFFFLVIFAAGDKHLNSNGPFGKRHTIDSEPNRRPCKRPAEIVSSSTSFAVASLNVSATVYSSNDQIIVTWPSISTTCQDDYIGIYFVEIPLTAGKPAALHTLIKCVVVMCRRRILVCFTISSHK